jgi:hypothetical protein
LAFACLSPEPATSGYSFAVASWPVSPSAPGRSSARSPSALRHRDRGDGRRSRYPTPVALGRRAHDAPREMYVIMAYYHVHGPCEHPRHQAIPQPHHCATPARYPVHRRWDLPMTAVRVSVPVVLCTDFRSRLH